MMKRNILAAIIPALLVTDIASATEIYKKNGNKLELHGQIDARHYLIDGKNIETDKTYIHFGFNGETKINDQLIGYAKWEYNLQGNTPENGINSTQNGNKTRLGFAGVKLGNAGSFDYGRNHGIMYDATSYTDKLPVFGNDSLSHDEDNFMISRASGLATYRNKNFFGLVPGLNFALQYQGKNEKGTELKFHNGEGWGTSLAYDTGMGINLAGVYTISKRTLDQNTDEVGDHADAFGAAIKYDANNIYLGAFYGKSHNATNVGANDVILGNIAANKTKNFEVVAQYQFDFGLRPSIAYIQSTGKNLKAFVSKYDSYMGGKVDVVKYIEVGTTYKFNKNMSTYIDYKINLLRDNDYTRAANRKTNNTIGVGIMYKF